MISMYGTFQPNFSHQKGHPEMKKNTELALCILVAPTYFLTHTYTLTFPSYTLTFPVLRYYSVYKLVYISCTYHLNKQLYRCTIFRHISELVNIHGFKVLSFLVFIQVKLRIILLLDTPPFLIYQSKRLVNIWLINSDMWRKDIRIAKEK